MAHYSCPKCGRDYAYQLAECSWCRLPLDARESDRGTVLGVTEVRVPSLGHEDVPYWCGLITTADGFREILKLDRPLIIGDQIELGVDRYVGLSIVGIIGTGVMGRGLAELLLSRGHQVVWCGRAGDRLESAKNKLLDRLGRTMDDGQVLQAMSRLATSIDYCALGKCDVVIEAVVEQMVPKRAVLAEAERHIRRDALLATNTSGLSLDELAAGLSHPDRFGSLHFFNPATRMRLVETAICKQTSDESALLLDSFARSLGKIPVRVSATPAFAVNRALMPLLNEAVRELEEGVASAENIDEAIRLGLNHPMGPLALADLIGLDVVVNIMDNLAERTHDETYAPRPLLRRLVLEGKLGRKTGGGFYDYS